MASYLDGNGLLYFWQKIKNTFVPTTRKVNNKALSTDITLSAGDISGFAAVATSGSYSDLSDKPTVPAPGTGSSYPTMNGTKALGSQAGYARVDHVHPSDTNKVDKVSGKGLSTNDYTTNEKNKLAGIEAGAEENQNAYGTVRLVNGNDTPETIAAGEKEETLTVGSGVNTAVVEGLVDPSGDEATGAGLKNLQISAPMYGTCSTAAGTAAKTVAVSHFTLWTGSVVFVKFTVTNTAAVANLTLNVNGTGAKNIKYRNSNLSSAGVLAANRLYCFIFDGTYWQVAGDLDTNTTYSNAGLGQGYGTCDTAAATAAKAVTLSGYALTVGGIVSVKFTNGIDGIIEDPTMNINSKGAKPIFYNGVALTGLPVAAGEIVTFIYDGTNYHLIATNHKTVPGYLVGGYGYDSMELTLPLKHDVTGQTSDTFHVLLTGSKGAANGVCPLNASAKIDASFLPSYVDDVIEAYPRSGQTELSSTWLSATSGGSALTPETGKIYVLMASTTNYAANSQFRWGGSTYVLLQSGEGISAITNSEIDTIVAS